MRWPFFTNESLNRLRNCLKEFSKDFGPIVYPENVYDTGILCGLILEIPRLVYRCFILSTETVSCIECKE